LRENPLPRNLKIASRARAWRKNMKKQLLGIKAPKKDCTDKKCPFHGEINVKNEIFRGTVVKKDINRSATISWDHTFSVPKYERFEIRQSRLRVHNPPCIDAEIGQEVVVARTRPLSKVKHHVILQVADAEKNGSKSDTKTSSKTAPASLKKSKGAET
jgi:small subunit ribosomal protein S17